MGSPLFLEASVASVKVIALKDHEWAGNPKKAGDTYEADAEDPGFAALLEAGLVQVKTGKKEYKRRDLKAEK